MRALILAGHGSHISPETAGVVWSYVDQLRRWGVADEITACFWKEAPSFSQVLDTIVSEHVTIVPVFTAAGYFSQTVIPAEMGLDGPVTKHDGRVIHYTRAVGEHPSLAQIVQQRVTATLQANNLNPAEVAVAVLGHGTPRNADSQNTARQQAANLRADALVAEAVDAYLEDDPDIASIYQTTSSSAIIAVPYFLASGSHVTRDVPAALGLAPGQSQSRINGRQIFYTLPVGTDETICEIILDLARETGQPFEIAPEDDQWGGFPGYGNDKLLTAVESAGELRFGELRITPEEIRPVDTHGDKTTSVIESPAALRKVVRENPFRPLATATGLPGGWHVPLTRLQVLPSVVETIYPGAIADWARNRRGEFRPQTLQEVSERQTGMLRSVHDTSQAVVRKLVNAVCGQCVRQPTWFLGESAANEIPCQAPCNWWSSRAKEAI